MAVWPYGRTAICPYQGVRANLPPCLALRQGSDQETWESMHICFPQRGKQIRGKTSSSWTNPCRGRGSRCLQIMLVPGAGSRRLAFLRARFAALGAIIAGALEPLEILVFPYIPLRGTSCVAVPAPSKFQMVPGSGDDSRAEMRRAPQNACKRIVG